jgi:hypothetical protein
MGKRHHFIIIHLRVEEVVGQQLLMDDFHEGPREVDAGAGAGSGAKHGEGRGREVGAEHDHLPVN